MGINIKPICKMTGGQDGAIYGEHLFRFGSRGHGYAYDIGALGVEYSELSPIAEFELDGCDVIAPHSNSVVFGAEKFSEDDEFPLLYSNVYNNYAKCKDKLVGTTCVYRIMRDGDGFSTKLVQLIEIGFTNDRALWRSSGDVEDVRPYGNFVIDRDKGLYIAFVMRDYDHNTRYFAFDLPRLSDGTFDESYGVNRVVLTADDIKWYFDTPYHNYIQGATCHEGRVYSVEGFHESIHPAIRVIDLDKREQVLHHDFFLSGQPHEAEFIDFYRGRCIYSDAHGNTFELTFG
ncbi:MAG: hypothetical protein IKC87_07765 [Clostridia bacterium]|nr:hypothetical protein [Clostridia bacterium]